MKDKNCGCCDPCCSDGDHLYLNEGKIHLKVPSWQVHDCIKLEKLLKELMKQIPIGKETLTGNNTNVVSFTHGLDFTPWIVQIMPMSESMVGFVFADADEQQIHLYFDENKTSNPNFSLTFGWIAHPGYE